MIAIFDTTVFNIAAQIGCCDIISLAAAYLFQEILVPQEVKNELAQYPIIHEPTAGIRIQSYIQKIEKPSKEGLKLCQTLEPVVFALLESKVDRGEAEAIAQAEKVITKFFFTDDAVCKKELKADYEHIGFYSTLHLISLLDVGGWLPDYTTTIQQYFSYRKLPENPKNKKKELQHFREEYERAIRHFGIAQTKKELDGKTSPKLLRI